MTVVMPHRMGAAKPTGHRGFKNLANRVLRRSAPAPDTQDTSATVCTGVDDTAVVAGVVVPAAVAAQVQAVLEMCSGAYLLTDDVLARTPLQGMAAEELERIIAEVDDETAADIASLDWEQQLATLRIIAQDPAAVTPPSWGLPSDTDDR